MIEGTFLALTGMSEYRSSDPEWLQKKQAGFGEAFKLVEEFRPDAAEKILN